MKEVLDLSDEHSVHMDLAIPGPIEIVATVTESLTGLWPQQR